MKFNNIKIKFLSIILILSLTFSSCNLNNTQKLAGIGAVAGGLLGGFIGNNIGSKDNAALGAALGTVLGTTIGGLSVGNSLDRLMREIEKALPGAKIVRIGDKLKIIFNNTVVSFETGRSELTMEAKANLDKLGKILVDFEKTEINIYGHTDSKGDPEKNKELSLKRAEAVKEHLLTNDVEDNRLFTFGIGDAEPQDTNETPEGRANNRRVEFEIKIKK
jgi:outer membrane protein OmpA-like peptidoglycan-associated protein